MRLPRTTDRRSQCRRLTRTSTWELCRRTNSAGLRWPRRWFSPPAEPTYTCGNAPMAFGCGSVPIGTPPPSSPEAPGMSLGARHDRAPGLSGEGQTTAAIASISSSVYLQGGHATDATRLGIHDGRPGGVPCDARFNAVRRGRGQARQPGALSTTVAQAGICHPQTLSASTEALLAFGDGVWPPRPDRSRKARKLVTRLEGRRPPSRRRRCGSVLAPRAFCAGERVCLH